MGQWNSESSFNSTWGDTFLKIGRRFASEEYSMLISGSCHCGNISFALAWEPEPSEIPARACDCSFCTKHGGVWTSCPAGLLDVTVRDPLLVSKYAFGTRTAEFHICSRCGIVPLVTSHIKGRLYAVVSVNAFDGVAPSLLRPAAASFQEETEEGRLARRTRNWIANVRYVESGAERLDLRRE
jgi:hypothetical protein